MCTVAKLRHKCDVLQNVDCTTSSKLPSTRPGPFLHNYTVMCPSLHCSFHGALGQLHDRQKKIKNKVSLPIIQLCQRYVYYLSGYHNQVADFLYLMARSISTVIKSYGEIASSCMFLQVAHSLLPIEAAVLIWSQ